jgi:hypothetical protein
MAVSWLLLGTAGCRLLSGGVTIRTMPTVEASCVTQVRTYCMYWASVARDRRSCH